MASLKEGRRKRKKKTCPKEALEEAIFECEALVAKAKKPRKPADYQFHRDPITGARDIHTPYRQIKPRIDPQMQPSLPLDGQFPSLVGVTASNSFTSSLTQAKRRPKSAQTPFKIGSPLTLSVERSPERHANE